MDRNVYLEGTLIMYPFSKMILEGFPLTDYDLPSHGLYLSRFIVLSMNTLL